VHVDATVVGAHQLAHDRQPYPRAARLASPRPLAAPKPLEDVRQLVTANADAVSETSIIDSPCAGRPARQLRETLGNASPSTLGSRPEPALPTS
jgi:hypothetical protein